MALFNYATKEITLKIVYYGPGLSGKTTNLQQLHTGLEPSKTGKLLSLATETDRTLFFDFLPFELGKIRDFAIRFQLYTVPGQVKYNATRKVVLKGADAVVFVADSQTEMREANIESFANMKENLLSNNINPDEIPLVIQYNKRDLPDILSIEELNRDLNEADQVYLEAEAVNGKGVQQTFQTVTKLVIKDISKKHRLEIQPAAPEKPVAPPEEERAAPVEEPFIPPPVGEPEPVIPVEEIPFADEPVFPEEGPAEPILSFDNQGAEAEAIPAKKPTKRPAPSMEPFTADDFLPAEEPVQPPAPAAEPIQEKDELFPIDRHIKHAPAAAERVKEEDDFFVIEKPALTAPPQIQEQEPEALDEIPPQEFPEPPEVKEEPIFAFKFEEKPIIAEKPKIEARPIAAEKPKIEKKPRIEEKQTIKEETRTEIIREASPELLARIDKMSESLNEMLQLLINIKVESKKVSEELKKTKEEQKEMLTIIREIKINETMDKLKGKKKKGWFS